MNIADIAAIVNAGGGGGTTDPWAMYDLVAYFDFCQGSVSVTKGDFSKARQKLLEGVEGGFCRGCYYSWDDSDHITVTNDSISMKYIEPDQDQWGERIIVNFFVYDYETLESFALAASWYPDNTISTE